jgi:PIN domain nuclease of toxin-antitoxin system
MRVLLDTCTLIWAIHSTSTLSKIAKRVISDENNIVLVSAASALEIATKVRSGRLSIAAQLEQDFVEILRRVNYVQLPILIEDALRAGRMTSTHKDPFDRIIAAQAIGLDIPVISPDIQLDNFAIQRLW